MTAINDSRFEHEVFLLTGIPGQETVYLWISFPFCLIYSISILGNSFIVFVIGKDASIHEPMYILLSMLAVTDLGLSITTMLTTLPIFLLNSREISLDACFAQLYFIHSLSCTESSVLLFMSFDRLIAISDPLRYASILTPQRLAKMWLVCVLRGVALNLPLPILLKRFQYCRENILTHSCCTHGEVMRMACSDVTVNVIYGLWNTLLTLGLDSLLIFLSYVMILKTVLSITSKAQCLTALNTCVSHLCAVLAFYMPYIGLTLMHRFGRSSSLVQIILGYIYLLFPPVMNPVVYSVKSKHLRMKMVRIFVNCHLLHSVYCRRDRRPKTQVKASCSILHADILTFEMT